MLKTGVVGEGNLGEQIVFAKKAGTVGSTNLAVSPPAVKSASFASEAVDRRGFNSAVWLMNVGAIGAAGNFTSKLQESDTTTDGDFTDVPTPATQGGWGAVATSAGAVGTANTDVVLKTDLRQCKRYVRIYNTLVSGTSVLFGIGCILGAADSLPAAQAS